MLEDKDAFKASEEQLLAEYTSLKNEIAGTANVIMHFMLVALTIASGAIYLSVQNHIPWPSLVGFFFALCSLLYIKSRLFMICKIGSYIEYCIEPKLKGLFWHHAINLREIKKLDRLGHFGTLGIYTFIMLTCLAAYDFTVADIGLFSLAFFINIILVVVIVLSWLMYSYYDRRKKYVERWKTVCKQRNR